MRCVTYPSRVARSSSTKSTRVEGVALCMASGLPVGDRRGVEVVTLVAQAILPATIGMRLDTSLLHVCLRAAQLVFERATVRRHLTRRRCDRMEVRNGVGVAEVGVNARHDDPCFHGDEVDPDERQANPRVNHDSLVQDVIEHIDHTSVGRHAIKRHRGPWVNTLRAGMLKAMMVPTKARIESIEGTEDVRITF